MNSTADYPIHAETIAIEQPRPSALYCTFAFNELLAVLDDTGSDTGQRARFVGLEVDLWRNFTGRANISIVNGPCRMIDLKYLAQVKH
jgi:hypothetical protein